MDISRTFEPQHGPLASPSLQKFSHTQRKKQRWKHVTEDEEVVKRFELSKTIPNVHRGGEGT